jgi:hypothetical protein
MLTHMSAKRNAYRALVGNPEGKRPLGRPRLEDNIKMDLREIGWGGGTDLIHLFIGILTSGGIL